MGTQEIYIRNATETEARGPFTPPQMADLAEAGQVTEDTLIYDAQAEQWVALKTVPELAALVFPVRRKLALKAKEIASLNTAPKEAQAITVDDMLAAAEGRTDDTRGKSDPMVAMARAARIGTWGAILALVAAAGAEILPGTDALVSLEAAKLIAQPLVVLGAVDLVLAVLLALGMTSLYPLIRFRAALGLGLTGFMFYVHGQSTPLLATAAGSLGIFLCTVVVSLIPALIAVLLGVGGMGYLAWQILSP